MITDLVEAGLLSVEEGKFCLLVRSRPLKHVGGTGEVDVARGVHGNAAANRGRANGISATEVGGIEHALGTAAAGVDLAGEELRVPGRIRHPLIPRQLVW